MIYVVGFFREYGVLVAMMAIGWASTQLYLRYAKIRNLKRMEKNLRRRMDQAKFSSAASSDASANEILAVISRTDKSAEAKLEVVRVHAKLARARREVKALEEQEKNLLAINQLP
jgi:uncharacterized membrane protein YciS (DUF1049 family)